MAHEPGGPAAPRRHVEWVPDGEQEPAWTLDFHDITMHAIVSADEDQAAALYLQVCIGDDYPEEEEESEEEGGDGQAALGPDLWLIPDDPEAVPALYEAFSEGAERNPDVDSDEDSDASGSGFCFNEEEALEATGVRAREIAEIENGNADRFEDAEEEEA